MAAWGPRGHGAVGVLAVESLSDPARVALNELLGATDTHVVASACYWPDIWEAMGDGVDTTSWHYVNIDPEQRAYRGSRDCPDGQCVTAQVNAQAERLGDTALSREDRRQAFGFLCHFVADLHQPLHVAYADDQGGSKVTIRYRGESMSLHWYWDGGLLKHQVGSMGELTELLRVRKDQPPRRWAPTDTMAWTNETFALTRNFAYPVTRTVDEDFESRSWLVTQQQLDVAAGRLGVILETVLAPAQTP